MTKLKITENLLTYDSPLVILAIDQSDRPYVGVNYDDDNNGYWFFFSRTKDSAIEEFKNGSFDLLYLLTKKHVGKFLKGLTWGQTDSVIEAEVFNEFKPSFLPDPGLFLPSKVSQSYSSHRQVAIDGRWGINDLRRFSDLVQDCYAFVFALTGKGPQLTQKRISALFQKYPWRGGYSSVNFFDDLYELIPVSERASISSIQYASPGKIELIMNSDVADAIRGLVKEINTEGSKVSMVYKEVHNWMREQGWLRKSSKDLVLKQDDKDALNKRILLLARQFDLGNQINHILELSSSDPLSAVKILLAYYRRLDGLADYVATGKAHELFI